MRNIPYSRTKPYEIVWHGRGGQGAVTAAKIVAQAAYLDGYEGVTATPFFGAERRGVPVGASTRISRQIIRVLSQVEHPDAIVVLDDTMLKNSGILTDLEAGGWLVVNSSRKPAEFASDIHSNVACIDATTICHDMGLVVAGLTVVNTAMLGALVRVTGIVTLDSIRTVIGSIFNSSVFSTNMKAIEKSYHLTEISRMD